MYFQGAEFDWLRKRVESTLWQGGRQRAAAKATAPKEMEDLDNWILAQREWDRRMAKRAVAAPPSSMSVEQYNAWRGGDPQRSAAHPYVYQQYPMVLYGTGGRRKTVRSAAEHQYAVHLEGYSERPVD